LAANHQGEACREAHTGHRPDDRDLTVFERLAERLADRPRELGQLVEEEHTPVRQADFAGAGHPGAAADQSGHRDGMVGSAERPRGRQRRGCWDQPGRRQHLGDLEGLVPVEVGQQPT
jgi:hypothetical protein